MIASDYVAVAAIVLASISLVLWWKDRKPR